MYLPKDTSWDQEFWHNRYRYVVEFQVEIQIEFKIKTLKLFGDNC